MRDDLARLVAVMALCFGAACPIAHWLDGNPYEFNERLSRLEGRLENRERDIKALTLIHVAKGDVEDAPWLKKFREETKGAAVLLHTSTEGAPDKGGTPAPSNPGDSREEVMPNDADGSSVLSAPVRRDEQGMSHLRNQDVETPRPEGKPPSRGELARAVHEAVAKAISEEGGTHNHGEAHCSMVFRGVPWEFSTQPWEWVEEQ